MTEPENDTAGRDGNAVIWHQILALDCVEDHGATPAWKLWLERWRYKLVRRYYGNQACARQRGRKHCKDSCEFCSQSPAAGDEQLHPYHINGNPWDNKPSNIGTLCADCRRRMNGWMMPAFAWCGPARRRLWFEVLTDARKYSLGADYAPLTIRLLQLAGLAGELTALIHMSKYGHALECAYCRAAIVVDRVYFVVDGEGDAICPCPCCRSCALALLVALEILDAETALKIPAVGPVPLWMSGRPDSWAPPDPERFPKERIV